MGHHAAVKTIVYGLPNPAGLTLLHESLWFTLPRMLLGARLGFARLLQTWDSLQ